MVPGVYCGMGNLLNPLGISALLFGAVFVVAFLYYWLWLLQPQSIGTPLSGEAICRSRRSVPNGAKAPPPARH